MTSPREAPTRNRKASPRRLSDDELGAVMGASGAILSSMLTNVANMRHELLKAIAANLRG